MHKSKTPIDAADGWSHEGGRLANRRGFLRSLAAAPFAVSSTWGAAPSTPNIVILLADDTPTFGVVSSQANQPRVVQLALKLRF